MNNTKAFTLIELLVVVLIIGILAAIAVPKYQMAVIKSQYNNLKNLVKSIVETEEAYYLANNEYTIEFNNLDIEMPKSPSEQNTASKYMYDWGYCLIYINGNGSAAVACTNELIHMAYIYSLNAKAASCWVLGATDADIEKYSSQLKICQQETGLTNESGRGTTYFSKERYKRYGY